MRSRIGLLFLAALLAPLLATASTAEAQAWVSEKGQLSLTLRADYQTSRGVYHGPDLVTGTPAQAINNAFSVEYVPVDKLSAALTLNSNAGRYTGPQTLPGFPFALAHGSRDDGSYHFDVTDLDIEARYMAYDGAVTLTPNLRVRIPVTDYENKGYAAAGMGLREGTLGFTLGKYGLGVEDLVLQLGYTFTYVQKYDGGGMATEQYRVNRSDADVSLAYIINEKFVVAAGLAYRLTHDGFELVEYPDLAPTDPLIVHHDPVLAATYVAPTAVANYQVTPELSLSGRFAMIVWGDNVSNAMTFGLSAGYSLNLASGE